MCTSHRNHSRDPEGAQSKLKKLLETTAPVRILQTTFYILIVSENGGWRLG